MEGKGGHLGASVQWVDKTIIGGKGRNSSLLALYGPAGMEQLTVSLSITHTPKPPHFPYTSLPMSLQVRAPFLNKYLLIEVRRVQMVTMLTTQHNK